MTDHTDQPTPDALFAILARELRTPLATIDGYLELLHNGDVGSLSLEQREYLDVVSRNVQRLTSVVSDWTEICRLEADRVELACQDIDLEEIVDRAISEVRLGLRVKEQRLRVELPPEPVLAKGDARALQRIVDNLISNAHKYTAPHGTIRIVVESEGEAWVRLDVVDTGIGLREEDQARLFRKFFRSSLTEAEPGTGLGLAICRGLVERMGGSISVTSALGKGSTFSVRLPRSTSRDAASAVSVAVPPYGEPQTPLRPHPSPVGSYSQA